MRFALAALASSLILAGCGGGSADTTPRATVKSLKVIGDSLADSGTFGIKFTVQGSGVKIYPERIADSFGLSALCNFFQFTGATFAVASPTCTNFAIGGGVINPASGSYTSDNPLGIAVQLAASLQTVGGTYSATDMLLIDGGGNDAAALAGAYLNAGTNPAAFAGLLSTLVDPTTVAALLSSGPTGAVQAGGLYSAALANRMHDLIKANAIDKGATKIVVLNMPGVTNTPRFQYVLGAVAATAEAAIPGSGAATRAQVEAIIRGWTEAFNAQLATRMASYSNVVLVDFYTGFNQQVANPAQFGLTNVTATACPATGVGTDGLPTYTFTTCTEANLSALQPDNPNWWKSYAFSDSFHPTPLGHQLLAQLISQALAAKGWL
jgi:phospholipase/lecithinase/hemolysin